MVTHTYTHTYTHTHTHTHTRTYTHDNYYNPRCAHAHRGLISVCWGPVNCIDRNRAITGYSLRYRVLDSRLTQTVRIEGTTSATLSGLMTYIAYSIEVAVNAINPGVYSDPLIV